MHQPSHERVVELNSCKARAGDGNRTHTTSLEGWSSTIELHPLVAVSIRCQLSAKKTLLAGTGFEPVKALPPDLQSGPFGHSGIPPNIPQGGEPTAPKFHRKHRHDQS